MQETKGFLPISRKEMEENGLHYLDFICVTGDAYVDHPSFGVTIIARVIEAMGYTVGILSQPDFHSCDAFREFGRPRYGFFVTGGNVDSMVAHYTAALKRRSTDAYSPGNVAGKRPDRATIVYCHLIREAYPDIPIFIGGLEASLRRFAHYDYWDNDVRRSILQDSGADLLTYGMGEHQTREIVSRLVKGEKPETMTDILGTCYLTTEDRIPKDYRICPSYNKVRKNKRDYAVATRIQMEEQDYKIGKGIVQNHGTVYLVQNPPSPPLTQSELDEVYALPYMRTYHPDYEKLGGVPSISEVQFSITHNRGCFGNCNFCSIAFHQGRYITTRSELSIVEEAKKLTQLPGFKGYIHDIGGPTANFRRSSCDVQEKNGMCKGKKCLAPVPCKQLVPDHREYLQLLRKVRSIEGIKKVFIRSGIRFDYLMADPDRTFLHELVKYHISGQLKVAPEHCSAAVLDKMGKPHIETYIQFAKEFYRSTKKVGKEQYLVPYLMSSHPGSTLQDAVELALFLKKNHIRPEQVQDFYPTPGTVSTCMYYTGLDPFTLKEVYVPYTSHDKALQRALLQYFQPRNHSLVLEALRKAGREDLIGSSPHCLVPATQPKRGNQAQKGNPKPTSPSPQKTGIKGKYKRKS